MGERRVRPDRTLQRFGRSAIGGSPLKLFRLTEAGSKVAERIELGLPVDDSSLVEALIEAGAVHPRYEASPFTRESVTVVVPAYNTRFDISQDAVIVDDASEPPITNSTIRLNANQGPAAARNAGLGLVSTPLVAFVDTGIELPDGWLDALLPHFSDARVALVAPRVATRAGTSLLSRYECTDSPLDLGFEPARVRSGTRVSYVPSAVVVCRTDAIRSIGGFDATLRFGEDVDLVWRLDANGWRCRYEPESIVFHSPRDSWRGWVEQRINYGSSAAPLSRRHHGALAPLHVNRWSFATLLLLVTGHPVLGAATAAGSTAKLTARLVDIPLRAALRLACLGHLNAGRSTASAVRRAWWPILAAVAVRSKTARRILLYSALSANHPLRLVDDLAYSLGVWKGIVAKRTMAPLKPSFRSQIERLPATDL